MSYSLTINIDPVLLQLGPFALRWYGLMYIVGIVAGLYVALPYVRRRGIGEDKIWGLFWWLVVAGVIGARLYYVIQSDPLSYLAQPSRIFAVWEGGMAFYGAVFATVVALAITCRRAALPFWTVADGAALFAVVGQGFGRIGNIVNGDIVGYATDLPWGVIYAHPRSFVPDHTIAYQPAAVYELLFNIALFALLWPLRFRLRRPGMLFATYLIAYSLGQFLLFFWRDNEILILGLRQAQLTALGVLIVAVPLFWWLSKRPAYSTATKSGKRRPRRSTRAVR